MVPKAATGTLLEKTEYALHLPVIKHIRDSRHTASKIEVASWTVTYPSTSGLDEYEFFLR